MSAPIKHGTISGYYRRRCRCPECKGAMRAYNRERRASGESRSSQRREERLAAARAEREAARTPAQDSHWWDEKLEVKPLADLLRQEVQGIGLANVASACRVDARRISVICDGFYWQNGKKYRYRYVTMRVVDAWCVALGYHARDLYPERF